MEVRSAGPCWAMFLRKVVGVHGHVQLAIPLANSKFRNTSDIFHIDVLISSSNSLRRSGRPGRAGLCFA